MKEKLIMLSNDQVSLKIYIIHKYIDIDLLLEMFILKLNRCCHTNILKHITILG